MIKYWGIIAAAFLSTPALAQDRSYVLDLGERSETVSVWDATGEEHSIILFGYGWGGSAADYAPLLDRFADMGYRVEAVTNLDSKNHPLNADLPEGFPGTKAVVEHRMQTMVALRAATDEASDLPVVLAGHSFGALVAMNNAEGRFAFGPLEGPAPAAVLAFSSPGHLGPLVPPTAYAGMDLPYMMITGTNDSTGTSMPTWEAHRLGFDRSAAGDNYLAVVDEGGHNMVTKLGEVALADTLVTLAGLFLDTYTKDDAAAAQALADFEAPDGLMVERR